MVSSKFLGQADEISQGLKDDLKVKYIKVFLSLIFVIAMGQTNSNHTEQGKVITSPEETHKTDLLYARQSDESSSLLYQHNGQVFSTIAKEKENDNNILRPQPNGMLSQDLGQLNNKSTDDDDADEPLSRCKTGANLKCNEKHTKYDRRKDDSAIFLDSRLTLNRKRRHKYPEYWKRKKKRLCNIQRHPNCNKRCNSKQRKSITAREAPRKRYTIKKHRRKIFYRIRKLRRLIRKYRNLRNAVNKITSQLTTGIGDSSSQEKCKKESSDFGKKQSINFLKWREYVRFWRLLHKNKHVLVQTSRERNSASCSKNAKTKKKNKPVIYLVVKNKICIKSHAEIPQKMLKNDSRALKMDLQRFKKVLLPQQFICPPPSTSYFACPLDRSYQSPIMRLHSFRDWPQDSTIGATRLVDNGFACIDNDLQKVECISCGFQLVITELEGRDLNTVHREHSPDCPFANGRRHVATVLEDGLQQVLNREESSRPSHPYTGLAQTDAFLSSRLQTTVTLSSISDTNVNVNSSEQSQMEQAAIATQSINNANTLQGAIGHSAYSIRNPAQTTSEARRQTFMYWPHAGEQDIDLLVDAGFFFTGTEDVVRCFYCDIGLAEWNADDDPFIEHARHSPDCPYLRDKKGQDYINQVQQDWARIYTPKRPELSQMNTRLRTFENQSWPRDQVAQTPQQLANAGFYYTGEGDTVRCHYCDGGLREWEPNDDPWVEHAKWFPFCKFVLKVKGIQFIQMSATGTPSVAPTVQSQNLPSTFVEPALRMSYVDECRRKEQRNPLLSAAAQSVKSMGYTRSTVWLSINSYIEKTGRRDFKARDLLDIILEREDKGEILRDDDILDRPQPNNEPSAISAAAAERDDGEEEMELTPEALRKENQFLVQKFKCLVCRDKDRCIVYVPCGHRIVCEPCGKEQKCCSHCGVKVERRVKTYLC